jgi:hypothetical protein
MKDTRVIYGLIIVYPESCFKVTMKLHVGCDKVAKAQLSLKGKDGKEIRLVRKHEIKRE